MSPAPPPLLRRLLAWLLPPGPARDGLVGDLDELYVLRLRAGRTAANVWYLIEVASAGLYYLPRRLPAWWSQRDRTGILEGLLRDFGFTARVLRRRPGFAALIVLTLALGIGASTAVLTVVQSVLLRPLPFPDDDRLAVLLLRMEAGGYAEGPLSIPEYSTYREQLRSWQQLAAYRVVAGTVTGRSGNPERVSVALATPNLFAALGVEPLLGRVFGPDESGTGSDPIALLSFGYWQSRYGADREVIGSSVVLEGRARTIVGVMPSGFGFPDADVRFWLPLVITPQNLTQRGNHQYSVLGRLAPGVSLALAEAELAAVTERVIADPAFDFHDWHPAFVRPLRTQIVGDVSQALWMILGAVGIVLAIACANVANLLMVRSEERAREMAVRSALGAGRLRLLSQLLTESLVMTTAGALAGVALAYGGVGVLRSVAPAAIPRLEEVSVDGFVLSITALVTLAAAVLFGVLPGLHVRRGDFQALREEARSTTMGRTRNRLRQGLVVSETALAVVLLISAGLLLQSFRRLLTVDPGYRTEQVLTARLTVSQASYAEAEDAVGFYDALLTRVASLPGVSAAGGVRSAPLSAPVGPSNIDIEGWVNAPDAFAPVAVVQVVTPGYFEAMGIPVLEGRDFDARDRASERPVAIVTESLAHAYWPGRSALGGRLRVDDPDRPFLEIVGVVPDVRHNRLDQPPAHGTMFLVHAQAPVLSMTLAVRSSVEPTSLVSAIRTEVGALDPTVPVHGVRTMKEAVADITSAQRFTMLLQLLFGFAALLLSAIGLYGVVAFTASRRTKEIGIRIALGAEHGSVQRMVVRQGVGLVLVAIVIGLMGALAVGRGLESMLYGTSAIDPLTYVVVVGTLLAVASLACWIPARRASSVDPIKALRAE